MIDKLANSVFSRAGFASAFKRRGVAMLAVTGGERMRAADGGAGDRPRLVRRRANRPPLEKRPLPFIVCDITPSLSPSLKALPFSIGGPLSSPCVRSRTARKQTIAVQVAVIVNASATQICGACVGATSDPHNAENRQPLLGQAVGSVPHA